MTMSLTSLSRAAALLAVASLALAGCAASAPAPAASPVVAGESVSVTDAWVKAADAGMSAAFGTVHNDSSADVTVVSAQTPASSMVELHETVANAAGEMVMQQKQGGFVIPAGGEVVLEPGANHIMLMDLAGPLKAGADATFTLTFSDGSTYDFTAPVKDYSGANETYEGGDVHDGMSPTPAPSH